MSPQDEPVRGTSNAAQPDPFADLPRPVTPRTRHAALTAMLERDRESAWQIAHYERGQRDEYTSKLRFGLAAFPVGSQEHSELGKAMNEAHRHQSETYQLSTKALVSQRLSASMWTAGAVLLAIVKAAAAFPHWQLITP